ncbi:MAG: beta-ketoacyl reductase, partial [Acidobacteriota bacterium]|nr:beta-ketoacyl reductase [Acidobacteriota bacterium]
SRKAGSGEIAKRIANADVREIACDASDPAACARLLQIIDDELPPLRGIVHCAGTLADASIANQTRETIDRVFIKPRGAANLARRDAWFAAVSSAAAVFGPPGQANYAAANAQLDAMLHEWRRDGIRAVTIDFGPVAEAGLAASRNADLGVRPLHLSEVVDVFERAMIEDRARVVAIGEWQALDDPLLGDLAARDASTQASLAASIAAIEDPAERIRIVEQQLIEHVANVLRARAGELDRETPFKNLGVDSLMALQIKNRLRDSLGLTVPVTSFWAHPTIAAYAEYLVDLVAGPRRIEIKPATPTALEIEEMSEEEAERLLLEKVR